MRTASRGFAAAPSKEEVDTRGPPIDEASALHCRLGSLKVAPADQNVDILRVTDGRAIDGRNPRGDGVAADDGVGHPAGLKRFRCPHESLTDQFHGVHHPLQEVKGAVRRRRHGQ